MLSKLVSHSTIARSAGIRFGSSSAKRVFPWEDALLLRDQLTEEERMVHDTAKEYCASTLMPRVINGNRNEVFDPSIMTEMGSLGLLGPTLKGYGCAGEYTLSITHSLIISHS